jgi:transposase-like protein
LKEKEKENKTKQRRGGYGAGHTADHLKEPFLLALKEKFFVTAASEAVGVGRVTVYEWRKKDAEFAQKMDDIEERMVDIMRTEAFRRAVVGTKEPMNIGGKLVMVKKYSDFLLDRLLRSKDPAFRDKISTEVNIKFVEVISMKIHAIINKIIPMRCPHCDQSLTMRSDLANELSRMSDSIGQIAITTPREE